MSNRQKTVKRDSNGKFAPKYPKPKTKGIHKQDSWQNTLTGVGVLGRDKRESSQTKAVILDRSAARDLWSSDPMGARIVEIIPEDMTRQGFELVIADQEKEDKPKVKKDADDLTETIPTKWEEMGIIEGLKKAACFERAYGGAAIFLGIDDGQPLDQPINLDNIRGLTHITVLEPEEMYPRSWYTDPFAPMYGQVASWEVRPQMQTAQAKQQAKAFPQGVFQEVHAERFCIFPGIRVTNEQDSSLPYLGFGQSVLARVYEAIRDHNRAYSGTALLLEDFAQAILKIKGLAELLAHDRASALQGRIEGINLAKAQTNTVIIDGEEEYERKATPVSGLEGLLNKHDQRLTAACGVPVTILMGTSPGGLNATGESDHQMYYDRVAAKREECIVPHLEKITRLLILAQGPEPEVWSIQGNPLRQESTKDMTESRYKQMQTDIGYINAGVLAADDVAESRFGGDKYSHETRISMLPREFQPSEEDIRAEVEAEQAMKLAGQAAKKV